MTEGDWTRIVDTNLTGVLRTFQAFAPAMIAPGTGRLIAIGSLASFGIARAAEHAVRD